MANGIEHKALSAYLDTKKLKHTKQRDAILQVRVLVRHCLPVEKNLVFVHLLIYIQFLQYPLLLF